MKRLIFLLLFAFLPLFAHAQPAACNGEGTFTGRNDVLLCESWSSSTWWQASGYHDDSRLVSSPPASSADDTSVITTGCFQGGPCLDITVKSCATGGASGALAMTRDIPNQPQDDVWLRYYLKIAPGFSADNWDSDTGCVTKSQVGGKMTGLADAQVDTDPGGQCGNGGAGSDGLLCWSGRLHFDNCRNRSGPAVQCYPGSTVDSFRFGNYWYLPPNAGHNGPNTLQEFAPWDAYPGDDQEACATGSGSNGIDTQSCGHGVAGLTPGVWHLIEFHVKMNTITGGVADFNGVGEGWIDGVRKYYKNDIVFRLPGHRGLSVRQVWFQVVYGGHMPSGPLVTTHLYMARLAVCKARCGAYRSAGTYKSVPFTINR